MLSQVLFAYNEGNFSGGLGDCARERDCVGGKKQWKAGGWISMNKKKPRGMIPISQCKCHTNLHVSTLLTPSHLYPMHLATNSRKDIYRIDVKYGKPRSCSGGWSRDGGR